MLRGELDAAIYGADLPNDPTLTGHHWLCVAAKPHSAKIDVEELFDAATRGLRS